MQRLKIALPDELRARLDAASAKSGQSVAEEIRSRVEASFAREAADQPTADFLEGLARMAAEIERETGAAWSKHAGAHEVFTQAILSRLEVLKPEGATAFGERPHATVADPTLLGSTTSLGSIIEFRLRQQPDFTSSSARRLMEAEYQRARLARTGLMLELSARKRGQKFPSTLLGESPDQPKEGGKR
jgi:hypothetical protein